MSRKDDFGVEMRSAGASLLRPLMPPSFSETEAVKTKTTNKFRRQTKGL